MGKMPETKTADTQLTSPPLNPRHCWRAVAARDTSSDGKFVYAVRSTGIYCRPSCPSRRPQRAQVQFFAVPETAERNGFRPCRRCRPRNAARSPQAELVGRLCRYIEAHLDGALPLESLATQAGLDRKSTRLNSSHGYISYAVFCLKKKKRFRTMSSSVADG